jgi:hypothetical protein
MYRTRTIAPHFAHEGTTTRIAARPLMRTCAEQQLPMIIHDGQPQSFQACRFALAQLDVSLGAEEIDTAGTALLAIVVHLE